MQKEANMKVFLAGGSGALGTRLIPQLTERGHEVVATTRSPEKAEHLRRLGAEVALVDALDREAVRRALVAAEPAVVIHQLTALARVRSFRNFDREFALTNRLRTEGTDNLLEGARAAGARRFIAQSFGNWNYEPTGKDAKSEEDPLDPDPPRNQVQSLEAFRYLESRVLGAERLEGIVLRYGGFYGTGTSLSATGEFAELVRKRRLPIVGDGAGVWSFVHIEDAAAATA